MNLRGLIRSLAVVGPAVLVSVQLFDPTSIVTSMAAEASFGFNVLLAALYSGMFLILVQEISLRLCVVTGKILAENINARAKKAA